MHCLLGSIHSTAKENIIWLGDLHSALNSKGLQVRRISKIYIADKTSHMITKLSRKFKAYFMDDTSKLIGELRR
jgi:hypothetical protein